MDSGEQLMKLGESFVNEDLISSILGKHIVSKYGKVSNVVFSPLLIQLGLCLMAVGSSGQTRKQLFSFLKVKTLTQLNSTSSHLIDFIFSNGSSSQGTRLSLANGIWIDNSHSLKYSFKWLARYLYNSTANEVDFHNQPGEVIELVNSWVEKETNGLVREILSSASISSLTRLVFANALYFKGAWVHQFQVYDTKMCDFHLLSDNCVQVPFMTNRTKKLYITAFGDFKVLRLPYRHDSENRRISMYFFLPDAKDGLPTLVEKICSESGFLDRHIPKHSELVGKLRIPKFKISFGFEASEVLKELGLDSPFSPGGLTEIVDSKTMGQMLFVESIFQKSFISVNEEGTEAAAATIHLCGGGCPEIMIDFIADHPFLFLLREDRTGVVLFIGQVLNPLAT